LQLTSPVGQVAEHAPAPQTWPPLQALPHAPQLRGSLLGSTHAPPHLSGQEEVPPLSVDESAGEEASTSLKTPLEAADPQPASIHTTNRNGGRRASNMNRLVLMMEESSRPSCTGRRTMAGSAYPRIHPPSSQPDRGPLSRTTEARHSRGRTVPRMPHALRGVSLIVGAFLLAIEGTTAAASIIHDPPPQYGLELEPHLDLNFGSGWDYPAFGWGVGARASIPIMSPGFVKTINDSVAISFGADLIHYDGYTYACDPRYYRCAYGYDAGSFWALYLPVTMQWSFWLTDKWSVFGEPGVALRHAFVDSSYCDVRFYDCRSTTSIFPAFFAGARFHFSELTALTMRLGYPTALSVGLSFF